MKNPSPVPRVYHKTGWVRFVGPALVASGALMLNSTLNDPTHWRGLPPSFWSFNSSVILLWGIVATASTYSARFKVSVDCIEIGNMFRKKKLPLGEIRGRRCYTTGSGKLTAVNFKLEPKNGGLTALTFRNDFNFDDNLWRWLDQLPDLDAEKEQQRGSAGGAGSQDEK